jgi:hypothetical protein
MEWPIRRYLPFPFTGPQSEGFFLLPWEMAQMAGAPIEHRNQDDGAIRLTRD